MRVTRTVAETRLTCTSVPRPLGFVPTMGALHAGHLSLMAAARKECATVAASIFVNPTQFGPGEDFERYPRNEGRDLRLLEEAGAALVFAPPSAEMYRPGASTSVHVGGPLTSLLEGASRPGHFDGVATIVAKLLGIVRPDRLFLGQKDAQQLAVVRRMVADLDLGAEVIAVPTMREPDGLAMSSRNAYLSSSERRGAARLYRALQQGVVVARLPKPTTDVLRTVEADLARREDDPAPRLEYVALVDPDTFEPAAQPHRGHLLAAAARLGAVRLIDNIIV